MKKLLLALAFIVVSVSGVYAQGKSEIEQLRAKVKELKPRSMHMKPSEQLR